MTTDSGDRAPVWRGCPFPGNGRSFYDLVMAMDEPRHSDVDPGAFEMAEVPREIVREAADEPRRVFGDSPMTVAPAHELGSVPHDPALPHPVQEEADEPRKRPSG